MDIAQLVITLASVVGIVLVGAMAVVPPALDAWSGRDERRPAAPAASPLAPRRRIRHRAVDLAA